MAHERSESAWGSRAPLLDAVDVAVLEALLRDARASQRSIARAVGMSAPAVAERIGRLERAGVITGYRPVINRERLGFPVTAYLGVQTLETGAKPLRVLAALADLPEVEQVSVITGPMDLMLHLRVRDHEHLRQTLYTIWEIDGVQRTETLLSLQDAAGRDTDWELVRRLRGELEEDGETP